MSYLSVILSPAATILGVFLPVLGAVVYVRRARALAAAGRALPAWRQLSFYAGLAAIGVAILILGHLAGVSLTWRVGEQLLIGNVATLLLVLGLTRPLLQPLLGGRAPGVLRGLAAPQAALALWALNLYLWQLAGPYEGALHHPAVEGLQQLCLLLLGINLWMCLLGPVRLWSWFGDLGRLAYVLVAWGASMGLANILLWSGHVYYPYFIHPDATRQISPLLDQNLAGGVMIVQSTLLTLGLFAWLHRRAAAHAGHLATALRSGPALERGIALAEAPAIGAGAGRGSSRVPAPTPRAFGEGQLLAERQVLQGSEETGAGALRRR